MRLGVFLCVGVLALAACSRIGATRPSSPEALRGCLTSATGAWRASPNQTLQVEASSAGPDCAHAVATIAVRDASGKVLWADAAPTEHLMTLAQARDLPAMQHALAEWIDSNNRTIASSSALPDWPQGANAPQNGEFPFHPEQEFTRDAYMALRAANVPVFCYVQGMESQACVALQDGAMTKVGVQSFPG
ncbi:MAG: hypothetical protein JSS00_04300 [Proteobacteria bacterium]|nr:hypothetical protein [Pseudomonadota bacterium]